MAARHISDERLQGWRQIADFLGQPVATAQRWAKSGMPVARSGRYMIASRSDLARWLGRESGTRAPVHIAASTERDLTADLKRGLQEARRHKKAS